MYFFGVKASDDKLIICDALTRKLIKISNIDATQYGRDMLLSSIDLYDFAGKHLGFLNNPERKSDFVRKQNAIYNNRVANITVVFSKRCNLACKYCYEQSNELGSSTVDIEQLCCFISGYMKDNDIDRLHIELYGGEPMIHKKEIGALCHLLQASKINFSFSMMTNGTLFDEIFFSDLVGFGLEKVEISIDGPESIHNLQRPMKNNKNCYKTVIANIQKLYKIVPIVIRVNLGRNNIEFVQDLLDSLVTFGLNDHCFIYFTPIINSPLSFDSKEEFSKIGQCYIDAHNMGFHIPMRIYATGPCYLRQKHSFAILPNNTIRKCLAIPQTEIGNINCGKLNEINYMGITEKCSDCDFYPICFGGCQYGGGMCRKCPRDLFEGLLVRFLLSKEV